MASRLAVAVVAAVSCSLWMASAAPAFAAGADEPLPRAERATVVERAPRAERAARLERAADVRLPAAGEAAITRVPVRGAPRGDARRVATMKRLRFDYRPTVFFVIGRETDRRGGDWLRIRVPGRPNGRTGWVRATALMKFRYVGGKQLVVDRSAREIRLLDAGNGKRQRTVLRAPVAVGKPSAPTPLGSFYLTAGFRPDDSFLGPWAFETSAYAAITDWPQGGIVGLHGTSMPSSVGHRASHGCLRVYNDVIEKLKRLVGPGTPLLIKR